MTPSSALCRAQQVYHSNRAACAVLENVRLVSAKAAVAWGHEARLADDRETRQERRRVNAEAIYHDAPLPSEAEDDDDWLSENPDRGFAAL